MGNPIATRQTINANGANNMTGTAVVLSDVELDNQNYNTVSFEIQITGTPTGTLSVEGSNQADPANPLKALAGVTFVPLPAGAMTPALPAVAGAALSYLGTLTTGARFVRLRYVNSGSTGQLNAYVSAKGP